MSKVINFPLTPLWNPNVNTEDFSEFILNKSNIDLWKSHMRSLPSSDDVSERSLNECFEVIEETIAKYEYVLMEFERMN